MNNDELKIINENSKSILTKSKNLLELTSEILENKNNLLIDDSWIEKLYQWADNNDIKDLHNILHKVSGDHEYYEYTVWHGLPRDKESLLKITVLNLENCNISELPKEIGNLVNLVELNLSGTKIITLPKEIGNLTNLMELDIGDTPIVELPDEIGNLRYLIKLYIYKSYELCSLPKTITKLKNLDKFDLDEHYNFELTNEQREWYDNLSYQYYISNLKENEYKNITIDENKVWIDNDTNLMWQLEISDNTYSYDYAYHYAYQLNKKKYAGYIDWRLPSHEELKSLLIEETHICENGHRVKIKFPLVESTTNNTICNKFVYSKSDFWDKQCSISFADNNDWDYKIDKYYIRCVHNFKPTILPFTNLHTEEEKFDKYFDDNPIPF